MVCSKSNNSKKTFKYCSCRAAPKSPIAQIVVEEHPWGDPDDMCSVHMTDNRFGAICIFHNDHNSHYHLNYSMPCTLVRVKNCYCLFELK